MANINGLWLGTYWQGSLPTRFEMTLLQGNNFISGNILDDGELGEATVKGEIIGRRITFTKCYISNRGYYLNYQGTVSDDQKFIQGIWKQNRLNHGIWSAYRQDDNLSLNLEKFSSKSLQKV